MQIISVLFSIVVLMMFLGLIGFIGFVGVRIYIHRSIQCSIKSQKEVDAMLYMCHNAHHRVFEVGSNVVGTENGDLSELLSVSFREYCALENEIGQIK